MFSYRINAMHLVCGLSRTVFFLVVVFCAWADLELDFWAAAGIALARDGCRTKGGGGDVVEPSRRSILL